MTVPDAVTRPDAGGSIERRARRRRATEVVAVALAVALPLLIALVALSGRRWYPVLDLAMTELRLRDVGTRETPLIGLPGRIGELPEQGSHPGPLSFWLLAPIYRLFGSSAWAMEVAAVGLHLAWITVALWIGQRRRGLVGVCAVALAVAVVVRGMGLTVLVQPWNPYLPVLAWLVVLLATWAVLDGDHWMLVPLVVAASFAAQTHIPYLTMAGSLGLLAVVVAIVRLRRRPDSSDIRPVAVTVVAFAVLWIGTVVDQIVRDPGNASRLLDHFGNPPDDPIGVGSGLRLLLRHLDPVTFLALPFDGGRFLDAGFDPDGQIAAGTVVLVLWVAAFVASVRRGLERSLVALHVVIGVALAGSWASMSRIFGLRWFYLTLWAWVTTTLLLLAIVWTAGELARSRWPKAFDRPRVIVAVGAATAAVTLVSVAAAPSTDHPEEDLGDTLGALVGPTVAELDERGVNGPVLVDFDDAYFFGSQAFGLLDELERAGFDAGMVSYWRVPATPERVVDPADASVKVVLVTGGFVDDWRAEPLAAEVSAVDPRTDDERERYVGLRGDLLDELRADGLDDLVALVDTNLFGLNVDLRISDRARRLSGEMVGLGQETAVFLAPADVVPVTRR